MSLTLFNELSSMGRKSVTEGLRIKPWKIRPSVKSRETVKNWLCVALCWYTPFTSFSKWKMKKKSSNRIQFGELWYLMVSALYFLKFMILNLIFEEVKVQCCICSKTFKKPSIKSTVEIELFKNWVVLYWGKDWVIKRLI